MECETFKRFFQVFDFFGPRTFSRCELILLLCQYTLFERVLAFSPKISCMPTSERSILRNDVNLNDFAKQRGGNVLQLRYFSSLFGCRGFVDTSLRRIATVIYVHLDEIWGETMIGPSCRCPTIKGETMIRPS